MYDDRVIKGLRRGYHIVIYTHHTLVYIVSYLIDGTFSSVRCQNSLQNGDGFYYYD